MEPPLLAVREALHVDLVALQPSILPAIHDSLCNAQFTAGWRSRGRYIPAHALEGFLTSGIAKSHVVVSRGRRNTLGLVELMDYEPVENRAQISVVSWSTGVAKGLVVEGAVVSLDEWFCELALDIVHLVTPNISESHLSTISKHFHFDGTLRGWTRHNGRILDADMFSITKGEFVRQSRITSNYGAFRHVGGFSETESGFSTAHKF